MQIGTISEDIQFRFRVHVQLLAIERGTSIDPIDCTAGIYASRLTKKWDGISSISSNTFRGYPAALYNHERHETHEKASADDAFPFDLRIVTEVDEESELESGCLKVPRGNLNYLIDEVFDGKLHPNCRHRR